MVLKNTERVGGTVDRLTERKSNVVVFEKYFVSFILLLAAFALMIISINGPLFLDNLHYKTSESAEYQTIGQDIVNFVLLIPICLVALYYHLTENPRSKDFIIMLPLYLIYMGLSYGIGMEWSDSRYSGNSEEYFYFYLILIISGLILLIAAPTMFENHSGPSFTSRQLKIYSSLFFIFLTLFAVMWIGEVNEVLKKGDTSSESYSTAPTLFWVIRYLDLGFSIPLGFISLYLLWTRPQKSYPIILLFYGFFVTMITAVNAMGYVMLWHDDPELQNEILVIFGVMAILVYSGYFVIRKLSNKQN